MTRAIDSIRRVTTENGRITSVFLSPLMEDHALAKDAFTEYREGIEVIGYDSVGVRNSHILADYALHWSGRNLWELKGNVLVVGEAGQRLMTQQLFWDVPLGKIYSNVDSRVVDGGDVMTGVGFEAEDDFSAWRFRGLTGVVSVDTASSGSSGADSVTVAAPSSLPVAETAPVAAPAIAPVTGPDRVPLPVE